MRLDEFGGDEKLDEMCAELEDAIFFMECAEDTEEIEGAIEEIEGLAEALLQLAEEKKELLESAQALASAVMLAKYNL